MYHIKEDKRAKAGRKIKTKAKPDHRRATDLNDTVFKRVHIRADIVRVGSLWQHIRGHAMIDELNLHRSHLLP